MAKPGRHEEAFTRYDLDLLRVVLRHRIDELVGQQDSEEVIQAFQGIAEYLDELLDWAPADPGAVIATLTGDDEDGLRFHPKS